MSQEVRIRIANNVKKYRTQRKLKREELSLLLGFDNSYISKLERCSINITLDKLIKISEHFNIDIVELFKK